MANATYGKIIYANTVGILSKTSLQITGIMFYPAAVGDSIDLNFWDEANPVSGSQRMVGSVTITGTNTITDADTGGVLTAARYPATNVLKIFTTRDGGGTGSTANQTYHLIETAGDDNVIVTADTLTNETTKSQKFEAYPARPFFNALQSTATNTHESKWHYFGNPGVRVQNLILEGISSNAYALIYFD